MSKMRKEYDPNKVTRRKRKPIIYIICEGKETETLYFKHFRSRNCLVDIIPISSKHKAAEHLVKHAKSLISQADYYPKDGDQLWCVFDCDDNKDSELQAAVLYAEKHGYKIAYSNPAFEYWYLLHFEKRNGYLKDSAAVIDILKSKGYLENYGKSVDVFEELQGHQAEAVQYAKERVERLSRDQVAVLCRDSLGVDPQDVEGLAFAWLAYRFDRRESGNLPSATGASGSRILGCLCILYGR